MKKLIDQLEPRKVSIPYFQKILWKYGINPLGLNAHFTIDAIARVIVAEMESTDTKARLEDLRAEHHTDF